MDDDAKQLGQCLPADLLLRMEKELMGGGAFEGGGEPRRPIHAGEEETARNVIDLVEWKRSHRVTTREASPRRR